MSFLESKWFQRLQAKVLHSRGMVQFCAPPEYGGPYVLDALRKHLFPLVWFELTEREHQDLVAQTNKMVEAFNQTLEQNILDYGITPPYIATILQRYDAVFDRYCFVYSGIERVPALDDLFVQLIELGHQVILLGEMPSQALVVISRAELRLTPEEAQEIAGQGLGLAPEAIQKVYQKSQGVFEKFWVEAHLQKGWAIPHQPCASGRRLPKGFEVEIQPAFLLPLLLKKGKHLEALDLAVDAFPEKVLEFLETSASRLVLQGEHEQLLRVLNRLPADLMQNEQVLRWRLETAYLMDQHQAMHAEVLAYLQDHEAPELRALAAYLWFFGAGDEGYRQAVQAVQGKRSALTVHALARAFRWQIQKLDDVQHFVELSFEAVRLAEQEENSLQIIRASSNLPYALLLNNQLQEALHWANWSVQYLNGLSVVNVVDRLLTINMWHYMKILSGELEGLETSLQSAMKLAKSTSETLYYYFNTTWSEYCLIAGHPEKALSFWVEIWNGYHRQDKGRFAYHLVRLLVALGRDDEAQRYAREAMALCADAESWRKRYAHLAMAVSLVQTRPEEALEHLQILEKLEKFKYSERSWIAVPLLQKMLLERLGRSQNDREDPAELEYLKRLTLHEQLEYTASVQLLQPSAQKLPDPNTLYLQTLGETRVAIGAEILELSPRQTEIIVLLALFPQGLSGEQLLLELYGDEGNYSNLKALISRLRRIVPIQSQPYKLALDVQADFLELQHALKRGDLGRVTHVYQGRLLEHSRAPGIENFRQLLEGQVKALVEASQNIEDILPLAEVMKDDLEVWEHLSSLLPRHSQHYAFVFSQVARLREELEMN
ncbi:helix-turn-helix domain-containing protein [Deinococcus misasensis]|uniref:helix-turn-helix domain-containing protein n=1 Tax=Deinococcus misasensis TaxID=392413 RepID=UPI00068CCD14|nr:helix-turn-helix domain-containing protein [Deinococcus misasensis]